MSLTGAKLSEQLLGLVLSSPEEQGLKPTRAAEEKGPTVPGVQDSRSWERPTGAASQWHPLQQDSLWRKSAYRELQGRCPGPAMTVRIPREPMELTGPGKRTDRTQRHSESPRHKSPPMT